MSSRQTTSLVTSPSNPSIDQGRWVIQIRRTLEEELEEDTNVPVCIYTVPKTLMLNKPEAYIPQQVALGPYHCWRPELYEMERYKLAAAKRVQKQLQNLSFDKLISQLIKFEPRIRACYHKYLDFSGETIAWMMAVDASFILEFLQIYAVKEGKILTRVSSRMSHLVDYAGKKSAYHAVVLRDILLLENQIPLFLLCEIMEFLYQPTESAHDVLNSMLIGLCKEISPFNVKDLPSIDVTQFAHLLDFLYDMLVPTKSHPSEIDQIDDQNDYMENKEASFAQSGHVKQLFNEVWSLLSKLNRGPVRYLKKMLVSKPLQLLGKLPWTMITRIPGFALLKYPLQQLFPKEDDKPEEDSHLRNENKPPLIEEITIPSVTELFKSGVRFLPTNGDITSIDFDVKTFTLYLPTISLDVNTEVVLRNLVAYEASNASGPLVVTRYTELMNGIIDTEDDAKILRDKGIVLNRLKSDREVADLWNGMSKSVKLTRVPFLDKVIEDVNKYHSTRWKVKLVTFTKVYVFGSWQFLTLLAAICLLLLMGLQAFCSVYTCSRILRINTGDSRSP